jgi:hypothetical protein
MKHSRFKYFSKLEYADQFLDGKLFCQTAAFFRDYEDAQAQQIIGDEYEGTRLYRPLSGLETQITFMLGYPARANSEHQAFFQSHPPAPSSLPGCPAEMLRTLLEKPCSFPRQLEERPRVRTTVIALQHPIEVPTNPSHKPTRKPFLLRFPPRDAYFLILQVQRRLPLRAPPAKRHHGRHINTPMADAR